VKHLLALGAGAIPATAAFVVVRNAFDLEDEEFLAALSVACVGAALVSASLAMALGSHVRRSSLIGLGATVLVPLIYVAYLIVAVVVVCGIVGKTCYS
jgi:hypothetical protein